MARLPTAQSNLTHHFIVILCGGTGPRLWPLSRAAKPKQFLTLFSKQSLIQQTVSRALKIVNANHIFLITNQKYVKEITREINNQIPDKNLLFEPLKKNTAMATLYAAATIKNIDPEAVITLLPSDHYIGNLQVFVTSIKKSFTLADRQHSLVAFGIPAATPHQSYGYLIPQTKNSNLVASFVEKPTTQLAQKLIKNHAFWNCGIYTFKISTILGEFARYQKNLYQLYLKLEANPHQAKAISQIYKLADSLSFDYAISEKTKILYLLPATFGWSDIGEWKSIYQQLSTADNQNVALNGQTQFVQIGSQQCLVSGQPQKLIGLVDVNNLAIIDTPDALLICNIAADGSYQVRDLVGEIVKRPKLKKYFLTSYDK